MSSARTILLAVSLIYCSSIVALSAFDCDYGRISLLSSPTNSESISQRSSQPHRRSVRDVSSTAPPESLTTTSQTVTPQPTTALPSSPSKIAEQPKNYHEVVETNSSRKYCPRVVRHILDSHHGFSTKDPRAYFTDERITKSLSMLLNDVKKLPEDMQTAQAGRVFYELGRKLVSKLNIVAERALQVLSTSGSNKEKENDGDGDSLNAADVQSLIEVMFNAALDSKEDNEPDNYDETSLQPITNLIKSDKTKEQTFKAALKETAKKLSELTAYFGLSLVNDTASVGHKSLFVLYLNDAIYVGASNFADRLSNNDRFAVLPETLNFFNKILNAAKKMSLELAARSNSTQSVDELVSKETSDWYGDESCKSYASLSPLTDRTTLVGSWNSFLYTEVGTCERLLKIFAGLAGRVEAESRPLWVKVNLNIASDELERNMPNFVELLSGYAYDRRKNNNSTLKPDDYLLDFSKYPGFKERQVTSSEYIELKEKLPARCYLAGRRWRLLLTRSLKSDVKVLETVVDGFAASIIKIKSKNGGAGKSQYIELCLPRLEFGLRGYSITGDKDVNALSKRQFPLKSPIPELRSLDGPFVSGARIGYKLGFKIGYNQQRNATMQGKSRKNRLETPIANTTMSSLLKDGMKPPTPSLPAIGDDVNDEELNELASALYEQAFRQILPEAARRVIKSTAREACKIVLRLNIAAGLNVPVDTAAHLSSIRGLEVGAEVGEAMAQPIVDSFLTGKAKLNETIKTKLGDDVLHRSRRAGLEIGWIVGALVGQWAAQDTFLRQIAAGGRFEHSRLTVDEFVSGIESGYELGLVTGKLIASSPTLDAGAPRFLLFAKPLDAVPLPVNTTRPLWCPDDDNSIDTDAERDLIPTLNEAKLKPLRDALNHTLLVGKLASNYSISLQVFDKDLTMKSSQQSSYRLQITAHGYLNKQNAAFLTLTGNVDGGREQLRGQVIIGNIKDIVGK